MTGDVSEPYRRSVAEVVASFETDAKSGLSEDEAARRLSRGRNELEAAAPVPVWRRFLRHFADVLVILLLVAVVISVVLWAVEGDAALPYEAIAIFAIVILNAAMGFFQEERAEKALAALRSLTAAKASVIRGGASRSIAASDLVPGDLILIEEGSAIPADARVVESVSLQVAEAALTGESLPVAKDPAPIIETASLGDQRNMVFSGTVATYGRGRALITATGKQTAMGRIAGLMEASKKQLTPLQKELARVGRLLGVIVVGLAIVMIVTILLVQDVNGASALFDVLILGVALAVAAVPEGLPVVVTVVLSVGVRRMARRNAIIRHLAAVETLGSANVIASDKTGTLTRNEMTVRALLTATGRIEVGGTGYEPHGDLRAAAGGAVEGRLRSEMLRLLTAAACANNASLRSDAGRWIVLGDPTEGALVVAARKAGLKQDALDARLPRVAEIPFASERKLMSSVHSGAGGSEILRVFSKGAPDVLLSRCTHELVGEEARPLAPEGRVRIMAGVDSLADDGLRTLGLAFRSLRAVDASVGFDASIERDLVFLGLVGMMDPPRSEAKEAIASAHAAGIRVLMITGDHPRTAAAIARELGIATNGVMTGVELERATDAELDGAIAETTVFARVNPEHKLRIVGALQRDGEIVAMTGDGVNDAPALKAADIGIAMGITGTDVSKEASDMVLADDNFASIVAAVEEGRGIFSNIQKFLRYLLSSNIGEVLTMLLGVVFADVIGLVSPEGAAIVLPLLATQILWINLVTDGAPALALGMERVERRVMTVPPRPRAQPVVTRRMWAGILFVGVIMASGTLLVLDASLPDGLIAGDGSLQYGQTMAFTTLMLFQVFNVFNARSDRQSALHGLFRNRWLWAAIGFSLLLQLAVVYLPVLQTAFSTASLAASDWLVCAGAASSVLILSELGKLLLRWAERRGGGRPTDATPAAASPRR